jgi:hypothetical protein
MDGFWLFLRPLQKIVVTGKKEKAIAGNNGMPVYTKLEIGKNK